MIPTAAPGLEVQMVRLNKIIQQMSTTPWFQPVPPYKEIVEMNGRLIRITHGTLINSVHSNKIARATRERPIKRDPAVRMNVPRNIGMGRKSVTILMHRAALFPTIHSIRLPICARDVSHPTMVPGNVQSMGNSFDYNKIHSIYHPILPSSWKRLLQSISMFQKDNYLTIQIQLISGIKLGFNTSFTNLPTEVLNVKTWNLLKKGQQ